MKTRKITYCYCGRKLDEYPLVWLCPTCDKVPTDCKCKKLPIAFIGKLSPKRKR